MLSRLPRHCLLARTLRSLPGIPGSTSGRQAEHASILVGGLFAALTLLAMMILRRRPVLLSDRPALARVEPRPSATAMLPFRRRPVLQHVISEEVVGRSQDQVHPHRRMMRQCMEELQAQ